ncbi:MAG: hypothetical protein A3G75_05965, partial [Verrucomicrobia bacterium RIFCSPLOWO2_12_FULL_64_8]
MNNNRLQVIRVGLFFLLGLALLWTTFVALNGGRFSFFKEKGYALTARFDNLKGLKKGDEVTMAGVKVGSVAETRLAGQQAEALLNINPGVAIAGDAVAMVAQSSLLGTSHLEVSAGSPGAAPLGPGAVIATKSSTDLNEVIAQLGHLGERMEQVVSGIGKNLGSGEGGSLFTKVDKLVTENGPKLTEAINNIQEITAKLRQGEGTLGKLVNDPKLHDELLAAVDEIKKASGDARSILANAQTLVDQVKSGKGTLGTLIYDDTTGKEIQTVAKNLRELSEKLNNGQGTLG